MKRLLLILVIVLLLADLAYADAWVRPYRRADGVQVRGHWRSSPDDMKGNNFGPTPRPKKVVEFFI